jgi:GNAT superfamily N-acetyltransferase
VFGFSFSPWLERKLWDERYESYSIIENGKMLSNVCIFKAELVVSGEIIRANRFGAIATRKDSRGRGLSRRFMEHVLSLYPGTPSYLSANPSVIEFYPRFGFRQIQTHRPEIAIKINNAAKAVKLELDDPIFTDFLHGREIFSNIVDCKNTQTVQIFNLLMEYDEDIYFLPEPDVIVIAQQNENRLFLADVLAKKPIIFERIVQMLPFDGVETVEFGFCPDWLDVEPMWVPENMTDEPFFIRGNWNLPKNFRFPVTSDT